jgi:transposase
MISEQLSHLDDLEEAMERVSAEIEQRLQEADGAIALLDTVPGISQRAAHILVAELGTDLSRFPSAKHLASWAGMCPGNKESGGKRLSGKTRNGNVWLRQVVIEIAHVAAKTKATSLAAQDRRIAARRGKQRALVALGHTIRVRIYHILTRRAPYRERGGAYFDQLERQRVEQRLVRRLERLGYRVALQPALGTPELAT